MLLIRESHGLGGLQTAEIYFWRLKGPRPKHRQILYLVRICFFFVSCFRDSVFFAAFSLAEGPRDLSEVSIHEGCVHESLLVGPIS